MTFIRCNNCDWSQDDYWEMGGYNPIQHLLELEGYLFKDKIHIDENLFWEAHHTLAKAGITHTSQKQYDPDKGYWLTGPQFVALELVRAAKSTAKMKYRTPAELQTEGFKCPSCGHTEYVED